jgi:glutamate N-acetyltransferase/amino-acid N-acetyltransferase
MGLNDYRIKGFKFSAVCAGIKNKNATKLDMALIVPERPATVAGVTTTNLVYAAPIEIMRENLKAGLCSGVILNSGNANACAGANGLQRHRELINALAKESKIPADSIIPMSTGVIGEPLPIDRMAQNIPELVHGLDEAAAEDVAKAIMTTDTIHKIACRDFRVSEADVRMVGMAKGSGMIAPNMATMLGVIMIDARLEPETLDLFLREAVDKSFNRITIDGDMSTNDAVVILSGARADSPVIHGNHSDADVIKSNLIDMCAELARLLVMDGEGATKLARVIVKNAPDQGAAVKIARTISESPLVKTALNGSDPNWGRIMAAAGRAGVGFDPYRVELYINDVKVYSRGGPASANWEERAARVMTERELTITLDLAWGNSEASFITTDFSKEYVSINADYRS